MLVGDHTETESMISDSLSQAANSHIFPSPSSPHPDRTLTPHSHTPSNSAYSGVGYSEITPGDSASMANGDDMQSTLSSHGNGTFAFKFNYGNKTHRFRCVFNNYAELREAVRQKIMADHLSLSQSFVKVGKDVNNDQDDDWLNIAYLDDEDDQVLLTCDADLQDAVLLARKLGQDRVRLFVQDTMASDETPASYAQPEIEPPIVKIAAPAPEEHEVRQSRNAHREEHTVDDDAGSRIHKSRHRSRRLDDESEVSSSDSSLSETEDSGEEMRYSRRHRRSHGKKSKRDIAGDMGLPIPQEMLLPAAITFLGVVILGIFTITRFSGGSSGRRA
ncbi:hypothetical protein BX666DRAFT_855050 [Dichotomocladium elegans]|nr:hypothetical protein BX666DRAFT_855050 [Dichotomocladium elegans]